MSDPLERFVHSKNMKLLAKQLETETDETRRKMLLRLLVEEEAKPMAPDFSADTEGKA